jgi:hypothetical protein
MAHHAADKHSGGEQHQGDFQGQVVDIGEQGVGHAAQRDSEQAEKPVALIPAVAIEAEDEAEQIESERKHPEKRDCGDILRKVIGHRQQQRGGAGGQADPLEH